MANDPQFYRYVDLRGEWRWRFIAANGRTMADSGEGYDSLENVNRAIETLKREVPSARLT